MASPILNVPIDIMRLILDLLASSPIDLRAICLTHRDFLILAEPLLYAHIRWTYSNSRAPPIIRFLRSILRRPQLAGFVKSLVLNGASFEKRPYHTSTLRSISKLPVIEADLDWLVERIKLIDVPYGDSWIQELRAGNINAFVALLLSQLPRLRCLHLDEIIVTQSLFLSMMLRTALCERPRASHLSSFENLQDVTAVYFRLGLDIFNYGVVMKTAGLLSLFYLPSVKHITASIHSPGIFAWPATQRPNPTQLTSLNLTLIREGQLGQILSVTKGLKKFQWHWYYHPVLEDQYVTNKMDFDRLAADLSHVRETLMELTITASTDAATGDIELPPLPLKGPFTAFKHLDALKHLELPLPLLMGFSIAEPRITRLAEALPKNIEYLTTTDDMCFDPKWDWPDTDWLEVIRTWLENWKETTPNLRGFHLLLKILDFNDWGPEMRQNLRDVGAKAGVRIRITKLAGDM
ncbi:hypothetical protein FQN52_001402 [Onygenales sp. PD_12]|nr:hypothetical protein FQN52_001402 [Onygenales sp. PD_12]KAK2783962.1 hypothetical protein FQN53_008883 [Emmonsiellopsis sp. PD_33]